MLALERLAIKCFDVAFLSMKNDLSMSDEKWRKSNEYGYVLNVARNWKKNGMRNMIRSTRRISGYARKKNARKFSKYYTIDSCLFKREKESLLPFMSGFFDNSLQVATIAARCKVYRNQRCAVYKTSVYLKGRCIRQYFFPRSSSADRARVFSCSASAFFCHCFSLH